MLKRARGIFSCCLPRGDDEYSLQPLTLFQRGSAATMEEMLEASARAREECWQQIGTLEPLVLSHLVNPALIGGPRWPAMRQAFRVVRRPNGNVIIASDGLSDPFDDISLGEPHHPSQPEPARPTPYVRQKRGTSMETTADCADTTITVHCYAPPPPPPPPLPRPAPVQCTVRPADTHQNRSQACRAPDF